MGQIESTSLAEARLGDRCHSIQKLGSQQADDEGRLPKLHSQVWLSIYNLVMDPERGPEGPNHLFFMVFRGA